MLFRPSGRHIRKVSTWTWKVPSLQPSTWLICHQISPIRGSHNQNDPSQRENPGKRKVPPTVEDPDFDPKTLFKDQNDTWVDRHMPAWTQPYCKIMRIDRPIGTIRCSTGVNSTRPRTTLVWFALFSLLRPGTWLLLWPSLWSISLASSPGEWPDIRLLSLFGKTTGNLFSFLIVF